MARDDLVSVLRVACTHDDGVDWARVDCTAYAGNIAQPGDRDPAHIVPAPGRSVTWFHLRPIATSMFCGWVESMPTIELRYVRAFQAAVDMIENLEPGSPGWRGTITQPDGLGKEIAIVGDAELEHVRVTLGMPWIYEIGRVAYQRAAEGNTRGGSVRYTLPPTSLAASSLNARLHAEWLRTSQEKNSAAPASDPPSQGVPSS
jgi:hypothetical protein